MKNFFKYLLASILGVLVSFLIIFLLFMGIIGAMVSSKDKPVIVKENTIFHLTLDKIIIDRASDNPFDGFSPLAMTPGGKIGLNDILENIDKAGKDENIKGIFLDLTSLQAGMATISEIRDALLKFKESGKFVISYSDAYSQGTYYLATAADKIYLTPTGFMELVGLRSEMIFLKGSLEKLGLEPQIIRHGKFKSAIEPLILDKMSEESRLQVMTYLTSMWDYILVGISEQRNIPAEKLNEMATNLTIRNANAALNNGLIDGIKYRDEITTELKELVGIEESKDLNIIKLANYKKVPKKKEFKGISRDKIAVVYATGNIIIGEGGNESNWF
jgi:protease IV